MLKRRSCSGIPAEPLALDDNLIVRSSNCISAMLLLAGCGSAPSYPPLVVNQKREPSQAQIRVVDTLGAKLIRQPRPVYPKEAKKAHIQGDVRLDIVIAKTGEVREIHVLSGDSALVPAAVEAVKQWQYAPTRLNGEPVEIKTRINVSFNLNQ